ncbi:coth protein-domain-containing protein [Helicostylum pulchrum]|nr:coth protein-domain-containing protein [Helicostylum pulchrum]
MQLVYSFLLLLLLWSLVSADILYSVINNAPDSDTAVIINGKSYPLERTTTSSILFQGKAPSNSPYHYATLAKGTSTIQASEEFTRSGSKNDTLNEFFGRSWNKKPMVSFQPITSITKNFDRQPDNELLHPTGEIATIHVVANQAEIDNMHKNYLEDITVMANVTHISTTSAQSFSEVKFEIGGRSSRRFTKLAYNIKLPKKTELGGYRKLKLRTTTSDPSYMREYLATEMIHAANQPCSRASYIRLFLNDRPIGLFSLLEKYDDLWLQNQFNEDPKSNGVLYEGEGGQKDETRADLSYKGDDATAYTNTAYSISEDPAVGTKNDLSDLISFTKFINDQLEFQKTASSAEIDRTTLLWEKQLDVEGFLVGMAFEFLQGSWDAYLQNTNNYFLYKSPTQKRFIFISWDFDYVMGSGPVSMKAISVGDYNDYGGVKLRPLMVALMKVPSYRSLFEKNLDSLITNLYDPSKSFPVIDSVTSLIEEDVAWDKSLPRVRKGLEFLSLDTFLNAGIGGNAGKPLCISYLNAVEFIVRVNANVSHKKAVEGKTGHSSLYAIKPWIKEKLENIQKKTSYKPPLIPLF